MFLDYFEPASVNPRDLVSRDRDLLWLTELLSRYLRLEGEPTGRALCVAGAKGVGKSILTRAALEKLKADFSSNTLFLCVDCRSCHSRREVLSAIANEIVRELDSLRRATVEVPEPLIANAQLLTALARLDEVDLKVAHEHVMQYKLAGQLGTSRALLDVLMLKFGISVERTEKEVRSLSGVLRFDDLGLTEALRGLFTDVRGRGFGVVLYLDNIDELRHQYNEPSVLAAVRRDVDGVLSLARAPIGLVLNMRKYYTGVLTREISNTRVLHRLPKEDLHTILKRRIEPERDEVRAVFGTTPTEDAVERLVDGQPTPLSFLMWTKFLFEEGALSSEQLSTGFNWYLESHYSNIEVHVLRRVAAAFPTPGSTLTLDELLAECGGNGAVVDQLLDRQVVLPRDFWNPVEFMLDPEMHFLHPSYGVFDVAASG